MTRARLTPLLVGQCPDDWQQVSIDEVTELLTNGYVGPSLPYQTDDTKNGVRYLQGFNVRPNKIDFGNETWVTKEFHERNPKSCLREGDLLVVQSGHIGTAAVVPGAAAGSNCHALIIGRFDRCRVDPHFVSHYINSEIGQARLRGLEVGSSMLHINTSELGRFILPLPPIGEQRRLAEILGLWEEAIEKTERLIGAKERRYAGLINQLIIHRDRRSKAWEHRRINEISDRIQRQSNGVDYPLLTISSASGFIRQEEKYSRYMAGESAKTYTLLKRGEFAYNKGNSLRYEFGCVFQLLDYDAALVPSVYVSFRLHDSISDAYMRHLFAADYLKPQLRKLVKTGVRNNGLLNIRPDEFMNATVPVPPFVEQERISTVLDEARDEIRLLSALLENQRLQKRGLMQKLLTGEWRMPVAEEVTA